MKSKVLTLLALLLLAIPATSPYFLPDVPRTNDLFPHLYRTFAFDRAIRLGSLWPRWSPHLVYGYGYPVFNFFPSLFHWTVELFHLVGLPLLTAYRAVTFLHFWGAAAASYALGRTLLSSRLAGWAAAVAYTYSPFLLYDAHVRGSAPEMQALALLPLLILALWQAGEKQLTIVNCQLLIVNGYWLLATAVLFAVTFLSHPIVYQLMLPVGLWLLIRAWYGRRVGRFWSSLVGPALGLALGGLLVAFFWLPAFVEVQYTRADASISQGYAYQANFLTLREMVRWPHLPADPALVNPPVVRPLPVVALAWAAVVLFWRWRKVGQAGRQMVVAWTAVLLLCVWLITPASRFVWDYFPLLRLTFYPWRLLSMASVAAAVLAAVSIKEIGVWRVRLPNLPVTLFTLLIVVSAIPWLYPPREPAAERVDLTTVAQSEIPPFLIGTTTLGEFLPAWVEELPEPQPLRDELIASGNPDRLQAAEGLQWTRIQANPVDVIYSLQASQPLSLTYRQFYFPGWRATLDGAPVAVTPDPVHGLITLPVPAGEHTLHLTFGSTWSRLLGWAISGLGVVLGLGLAWGMRNAEYGMRIAEGGRRKAEGGERKGTRGLLALGVMAVGVWIFFTVVDTPLRRPTLLAEGVLGKPDIAPLDYAGELRLLTYEQSAGSIRADEPIQLTLYWQPQRPIGVSYDVGVQIVDADGLPWTASGDRPDDWRFIGGHPWPLDGYRMDPFVLRLLDGVPPGEYRFHVGLVRSDTGQTIAAHDLGDFRVSTPARAERPLEDGMAPALETAVAGNLRLLGGRLDRGAAAPGDPVRVATLWQAADAPVSIREFTLQLIDAAGASLLSQLIAIAPGYPAAQWQPGDRLRSDTVLRLPAGIPGGEHVWQALWGDQVVDLGRMVVTAPARTFDVPALDVVVEAPPLGNVATLLGALFEPPLRPWPDQAALAPATWAVTLAWRAEAETAVSYRVFVHLLGPDNQIVAQSDGEPVGWTRPTTGWLPGEIVLDRHTLALPADFPPGMYTLMAGLYDVETGQRLATPEGQDSVTVTVLQSSSSP